MFRRELERPGRMERDLEAPKALIVSYVAFPTGGTAPVTCTSWLSELVDGEYWHDSDSHLRLRLRQGRLVLQVSYLSPRPEHSNCTHQPARERQCFLLFRSLETTTSGELMDPWVSAWSGIGKTVKVGQVWVRSRMLEERLEFTVFPFCFFSFWVAPPELACFG
jgi:hypothetical protein